MRFLLILFLIGLGEWSFAQVHVRGYYRSNGTYVQPHERTRPNSTVTDNYSYPGNYNPNTGRITGGTRQDEVPMNEPPIAKKIYLEPVQSSSNPIMVETQKTVSSPIESRPVSRYNYADMETDAALKVSPHYSANSLYAIPKGAIVRVTPYNQNYYRAEVNGHTGYVCICQVKKTFSTLSQ